MERLGRPAGRSRASSRSIRRSIRHLGRAPAWRSIGLRCERRARRPVRSACATCAAASTVASRSSWRRPAGAASRTSPTCRSSIRSTPSGSRSRTSSCRRPRATWPRTRGPRCSIVDPVSFSEYRLTLRYERTERRGPVFERLRDDVDKVAALSGMRDVFRLRSADIFIVEEIEVIRDHDVPAARASRHQVGRARRLRRARGAHESAHSTWVRWWRPRWTDSISCSATATRR